MKLTFLGAARTVTGSCTMIEAGGKRFCVDCGMHQGNRQIEARNLDVSPYDPANIDFILVTHAHIDHTGLIPLMVKEGFRGRVFATEPTRDLLDIMLHDSAHIQEMEAEWKMKRRRRKGDNRPVEPLYGQGHATEAMQRFTPVEYGETVRLGQGVSAVYRDAGHILGSAFIEIRVEEDNGDGEPGVSRLLFSGDLGRPDALIVNDPEEGSPATDYLFMESTYGDRDHKNESSSREELAEAIAYAYGNGEKVVIPAFAVERSQEIIYALFLLREEGKLPPEMPVYLDSPMAIRATEVFRRHEDVYDEKMRALVEQGKHPLELPNLKLTLTTNESKAINTPGPAVIISASGMANAGRIQHHLKHNLWREGAAIVFVGFQAKGTPGRRIVDGAEHIRLFGEDVAVNAKVFTIGGFSAHAGRSQILDWLETFSHPGMHVFLLHGEASAQDSLAEEIKRRFGLSVHAPDYLETCELTPKSLDTHPPEPARARPGDDMERALGDADAALARLKELSARVRQMAWEDRADVRERIDEINEEIRFLVDELSTPESESKKG